MKLRDTLQLLARGEASPDILQAAQSYEENFDILFSRFFLAVGPALHALHRKDDVPALEGRLVIAAENDPEIKSNAENLRRIANLKAPSRNERIRYLSSLLAVYERLPSSPNPNSNVRRVTIAPQREGSWLAQRCGWLQRGACFTPNAKRIHWGSGLIVGFDDLDVTESHESGVIIDGAIASGSTVMGILTILAPTVERFELFSVHAALEGVVAILRFADEIGKQIQITVGSVTEGLNASYYAVDENDPSILQVGDLGDTIAPVI